MGAAGFSLESRSSQHVQKNETQGSSAMSPIRPRGGIGRDSTATSGTFIDISELEDEEDEEALSPAILKR